jgi:hypothetical protein
MARNETTNHPKSSDDVMREALEALAADKELTEDTEALLDKKEAVDLGTLPMAIHFMSAIGPEVLGAMPIVDSDKSDCGDNLPDWHEVTEIVEGEATTKEVSRINRWIEDTPAGQAIARRKKLLEAANIGDTVLGVKSISATEKSVLVARESKRLANLRPMYRKALSLCQQIFRFDRLENIGVRIFSTPVAPDTKANPNAMVFRFPRIEGIGRLWKAGEYLVNTPKPILISQVEWSEDKKGNRVASYEKESGYSVSSFLGFKPDGRTVTDKDGNVIEAKSVEAIADDATLGDLANTNKRGKKKGGTPGQGLGQHITSEKQWCDAAMELYAYINENSDNGDVHLRKLLATKDDAMFRLIIELGMRIADSVVGNVEKRYNTLLDRDSVAEQQQQGKQNVG